MKKRSYVACAVVAAVLWIPALVAAAPADHVSQIIISQGSHQEAQTAGPPLYIFTMEIDTDESVVEIRFETPAGGSFTIPAMPDQHDPETGIWTDWEYEEGVWEWEFELTTDDPADLAVLGDGDYALTIVYSGGSDELTVPFRLPGTGGPLPQPAQIPVPLTPAPGGDVNSPVTFEWQACTDPVVNSIWVGAERADERQYVQVDWLIGADQTQWGPAECSDGQWYGEIEFLHAEGPLDVQGVECWVGKYAHTDWAFTVGGPFPVYEVWAGHTDYLSAPEYWKVFYNIDEYDYTRLGGSDGYTATFAGDYPYYVLVTREPLPVDCIQGSNGMCYLGPWVTGNILDGWKLSSKDQQYATVGVPTDENFIGFVLIQNPGDWDSITVVTGTTVDCPAADITGDCYVDLADLAALAAEWLTGTKVVY